MAALDDGDPWIPRKRRCLQSVDAQAPSLRSPSIVDPGIRTRCESPSWDQGAGTGDCARNALEYPIAPQRCFGMVCSISTVFDETR